MAIGRLSVKTGGAGKASAHAEYIEREGKYAKKNEQDNHLEYNETGNMPEWAKSNPQLFWQSADLHERKNGSTYREYEIALPRELDQQQRIELIQDFIQQEIGNKYPYQLAIHNPKAMDGQQQPHAHLMFNERLQDGIARDPEQYFKRYNSKAPEKGGAKKDNTGKDPKTRREEIKALRNRWEQKTNQHLERAGLSERIDMRSYQDQGIEKTPEKKLLPSQAKNPEIREALNDMRHSEKVLMQIDLGDLKQQLKQIKATPRPDSYYYTSDQDQQPKPSQAPEKPTINAEMREGMNKARERFEQMKAQKLAQERQHREQERSQRQRSRSGPDLDY